SSRASRRAPRLHPHAALRVSTARLQRQLSGLLLRLRGPAPPDLGVAQAEPARRCRARGFNWGRGWAARRGAPAQPRGHGSRCPSPGVTAASRAPRGRCPAQCAGDGRIGAAELSGRSRRIPDPVVRRRRALAGGADTSGVPVNRTEAERLGITFARAAERPVRSSVRAVGILKYAEPNLVYVNARVGGWVERLYADYVGKRVQQGEPLLALYSP